jgi:ankyrin repeat protein
MDDGDSRPPTRPASPSVFVEEPQSLLQILSPLHRATEEDDIRRVMELLAAGADVNEKATDGRTPLHVCAQANNTVMAEVLLYKSASIEVVDHAGKDPLRVALDTGSAEMACMLLSRGGPLDTLSGFIVDAVQQEHMSDKRLVLRCLGFVAKEGKEDELLELLSTSMQGGPSGLENALMEILHDAESSYDMARLSKSLADRKVKIPVASSEQAKEIGHESNPDVQATHTQPVIRPLEEAGKGELVQGFETPTKQEESYTRSPEPSLAETPDNDASPGIAHSGKSVQSNSMGAESDGGSQILPERWAQTKDFGYTVDDLGDNVAQHEFVSLSSSRTEPSEVESVVYDTQATSESRSRIIKPDSDALISVETASADTVPFKAFLHKQFSWEITGSKDVTSAFTTEQRVDSEQAPDPYFTTPPPPPPPPPAGHVFCVPLQDLYNRQQRPVPQIVLDCISILEHSASDLSGIYQYPPEPRHVERLKEFVETGELLSKPHDDQILISIRFTTNGIRGHMARGA